MVGVVNSAACAEYAKRGNIYKLEAHPFVQTSKMKWYDKKTARHYEVFYLRIDQNWLSIKSTLSHLQLKFPSNRSLATGQKDLKYE